MYDKPKVGIPLKEHPMPPYLQFNIYISLTQILEYEWSLLTTRKECTP